MKFNLISTNFRKLLIISVVIAPFNSINAGEYPRWHEAGTRLTQKIKSILIENGICQNQQECTNRELVFTRPTNDGLEVSLYSLSDSNLISKIGAQCFTTLTLERMSSIEVRVFEGSKRKEMSRATLLGEKEVINFNIGATYAKHANRSN